MKCWHLCHGSRVLDYVMPTYASGLASAARRPSSCATSLRRSEQRALAFSRRHNLAADRLVGWSSKDSTVGNAAEVVQLADMR